MGNIHSEAVRPPVTNVDPGSSALAGKMAQITLRNH